MANLHQRHDSAAEDGSVFLHAGECRAGPSRRGRRFQKIVFVVLDISKVKIEVKKVILREHSTLGNYLLKNEFGKRRPPRSGG